MAQTPECLLTKKLCVEGCNPRSLKCDWYAMKVGRIFAKDVTQGIRMSQGPSLESKSAFVEASVQAVHDLHIRENPDAIGAFVSLTMQHASKQIAGNLGVPLEPFDTEAINRMTQKILKCFPPPEQSVKSCHKRLSTTEKYLDVVTPNPGPETLEEL